MKSKHPTPQPRIRGAWPDVSPLPCNVQGRTSVHSYPVPRTTYSLVPALARRRHIPPAKKIFLPLLTYSPHHQPDSISVSRLARRLDGATTKLHRSDIPHITWTLRSLSNISCPHSHFFSLHYSRTITLPIAREPLVVAVLQPTAPPFALSRATWRGLGSIAKRHPDGAPLSMAVAHPRSRL